MRGLVVIVLLALSGCTELMVPYLLVDRALSRPPGSVADVQAAFAVSANDLAVAVEAVIPSDWDGNRLSGPTHRAWNDEFGLENFTISGTESNDGVTSEQSIRWWRMSFWVLPLDEGHSCMQILPDSMPPIAASGSPIEPCLYGMELEIARHVASALITNLQNDDDNERACRRRFNQAAKAIAVYSAVTPNP